MRRIFIGYIAFVLASFTQIAPAPARDAIPLQAQIAQTNAPTPLPAALVAQLDARLQEVLSANRGASDAVLAAAVGPAFDRVLKANAATLSGDTTLVVAMAREAMRVVVATPGLDAAKRVQIAAAIAAAAAKAAPTAAASILVAVLQALPAGEQTRRGAMMIAAAIDAVVPDAQLTASIGTFGGANAPPAAQPFTALVSLLTLLANQDATTPAATVVSPH